ncbi:MAG TPA: DUF483 domain-containing protein [Candidatus Marinimicrobia bacterium]|jgi:hypothetical protein|nr:DUF483 domain-containing protein [Candidatus Neomarinimicrobiota bacterium]HJL77932.1 DUF483 domain-containing protein [Candidatus Neomarinimicrobiota bacterium]|tara:strand:+ start:1240 stop:2139 length:900 start_codon:yes stop_codon:yes gene_type:complete
MDNTHQLLDLHHKTSCFNLRNIIETLAVIDGKKSVMRLVVNDDAYEFVLPALKSFNLKIARSDFRQKPAFTTSLGDTYTELIDFNDPDGGEYSLMVSRTAELSTRAMHIEDYDEDPTALGRLLGYPDCCTASYEKINAHTDWLMVFLSNTPLEKTYSYKANRIAYLFNEKSLFFDYFPCSLSCEKTADITSFIETLLKKYGMNDILEDYIEEMKHPILILGGVVVQIKQSHYNESTNIITFDLSKSRLHDWKVEMNADEYCVWDSNKITINKNVMEFYKDSTLLGTFEQTKYERLMIFQ